MNRTLATLLVAASLLAGCSGDGDKSANDDSPTPKASQKTADVSENIATDVLTSFTCRAASGGQWIAGGEITNKETQAHTYRVTVFLGSGEGTGHSVTVGPVEPEKSTDFRFGLITPADPQATCRVQVEILDPKKAKSNKK